MADLFVNYKCINCQDDITGIRVHCAKCTNFDFCLQCFAAGAEIGEHRNDHAYQFMDAGTAVLSIFRGKNAWSACEELRLLDAIEKYGFGNWEIISKHIETRSAEDAKDQYINKYLFGTIGKYTWGTVTESQKPKLQDHTTDEDDGPLGSNALQKLSPLDVTPEESEQLGYMPNRDCYEREYDPTAEQLISSLALSPDDDEVNVTLKLAQVDIYTRRLRERVRRKRLARDYQLVANFFRGSNKPLKYVRDQREFRDRFKVFAQFYTSYEYERLLASTNRERELRIRLSELFRYRWNGLTKLNECIHFEQHAALMPHKSTGPYGHGKTGNQLSGNLQALFSLLQHNKKTETNENEKNSNSIVQKFMPPTEDQTCSAGSLLNKNYSDNYRGSSGQLNPMMTQMLPQTSTSSNNNHQTHQQQSSENISVENLKLQQKLQNPLLKKETPSPQQLPNVKPQTPQQIRLVNRQNFRQYRRLRLLYFLQQQQRKAASILTRNEIQLCASLKLIPPKYLALKVALLNEQPSPSPKTYSPTETAIRNYLIRSGWLSQ